MKSYKKNKYRPQQWKQYIISEVQTTHVQKDTNFKNSLVKMILISKTSLKIPLTHSTRTSRKLFIAIWEQALGNVRRSAAFSQL